ncbi:MAG: two-component system response regulator [Legionellales bacterium]|nr:two-component system response regulator [Legionellales bacterium]|tara:strand:- start:14414 stop:14848 length:435 start_codon:yes stop_codon:yes gene_type:complete
MSDVAKNTHILLVDDDEVDVQNIQRIFQKHDIQNPLHIANDGIDALDMLRGTNGIKKLKPLPKLVLLDLKMPRMGGIEFLQEIRADNVLKSLVVFVLTSSPEQRDKVAAYDLNAAGYIIKEVGFTNFVQVITKLNQFWELIELP